MSLNVGPSPRLYRPGASALLQSATPDNPYKNHPVVSGCVASKGSRVWMVSPRRLQIESEINPHMKLANRVDPRQALKEWWSLRELYQQLGCDVNWFVPQPGVPDQVFTANAGVIYVDKSGEKALIPSTFWHPERQKEVPHIIAQAKALGLKVSLDAYDPKLKHEGVAELMPYVDSKGENYLLGTHGFRTDPDAHRQIAEHLGMRDRLILLKLVDPLGYHGDVCCFPIGKGMVAYYPDAFDRDSQDKLKELVPNLFAVSQADYRLFVCNGVAVDKNVVVSALSRDSTFETFLEKHGYAARQTYLGQSLKSGGSARCQTLFC